MVGVDDVVAWIALRSASAVGAVLGRRLAERFGGPGAVLAASAQDRIDAGCPDRVARALGKRSLVIEARRELERVHAAGARVVVLDDPEYPPLLRHLHDAPLYLIAKGM